MTDRKDDVELKGCPFCEGDDVHVHLWDWGNGNGKEFSMRCQNIRCGATVGSIGYNSVEGDIKRAKEILTPKWNTRADKAEPAIDVEKLYLNQQVGGMAVAQMQGVPCARSYNKAIDDMKRLGYIRTQREPIEGLEEALEARSRSDAVNCGENIFLTRIEYNTILKAAKRYHEGE